MPLLDHFHPPLSERRPWESFHTTWASTFADILNREVLPPGYIALEQVHGGAAVEIDVGTFCEDGASGPETGGIATTTRTVWTPATAPLILPAAFPPSATVEILATDSGQTLVAAIELASPANKDRAVKRRLFAAKCASYLSRGMGLIVIDVVTSRKANLHNEMVDLLGLDVGKMSDEASIYTVAYRPLQQQDADRVESWPVALTLGQPLPIMPLSLRADLCLPLDLEAAYVEACQRRRLGEVLE